MGRGYAEGLSELSDAGHAELETVVLAHLRGNCFPPIPAKMAPVAVAAIEACHEEDYDREIGLPVGVQWRQGGLPTASQIVDSFRLEAFMRDDGC